MKDLASSGIGVERRHLEGISVADEDDIWEKGIWHQYTRQTERHFNVLHGHYFLCREGTIIIICDMEKYRQ